MAKKHPGVYLRGKVYWIKYSRNGRPFRESSNSEKESDAVRLLNLRRGDIARGVPVSPKLGRVTVDELIEDVINDYRANAKRTVKDVERRWKLHLEPVFGGRRASSVTTADVNKFIAQRLSGDDSKAIASNGEINRELTVLKRAFSLAIKSAKLMAKPHIPMLRENNVRTGFFEPEDFRSVVKQLPEHVKPVARFAYITGWRTLSEILPLEWRQVDFEAGAVTLDPGQTKNREGRVFPMTVDLRAVLEEQKAKRQQGVICRWVFTYQGNQLKSYYKAWRNACKRAGKPGMLSHDFRRTAVRNLVRAGVPELVAMKMTGHKTRSVFDRYNIVSPGDLRDAASKLDTFTGTISGTDSTQNVQSVAAIASK
jgi:integrase